ncbi:hypothetical protein QQS21_011143 [Conoideocrella luteorostrata]|uniref:Uncharacterized protein n=1 Tax=Conoideocrella luteorostrata TaxID=1105319 RepID=A0AAJ0CEP7_9HYPO|nr:hypothetical protein QQS21_011143 [Conoideocrella luteorostrata]
MGDKPSCPGSLGRGELLFVPHAPPSSTTQSIKAATKARLQQHAQQRRRRAEAQARGVSTPAWAEFTSTLQLHPGKKADTGLRLSEMRQPVNNSSDPFHSTVVGKSAGSHLTTLRIVFSDVVRQNFLIEAFAPVAISSTRAVTRHDAMIHKRLVQCVHDEMLMCATLAYALSFLCWARGRVDLVEDADMFHLKALQALRSHIQRPQHRVDDWLLISIYSLAITEGWRDMIDKKRQAADPSSLIKAFHGPGRVGHQIHLKTILQIIEDAGGWGNVDPYVVESIILGDKHASFARDEPPMLRAWWDPGPLPANIKQRLGNAMATPSMGSELLLQHSRPEILQLLRDCIDYFQVSHVIWRSADDVTLEAESWLSFRLHALQNRLLWVYHESKISLERCTSLAALVVLLTCQGMRAGAAWMAKKLCRVLDTTADEQTGWNRNSMTWLCFIGAMAAESRAEQDAFILRLARDGDGYAGGVEQLESILTAYMYFKPRQDRQLFRVVQQLEDTYRNSRKH